MPPVLYQLLHDYYTTMFQKFYMMIESLSTCDNGFCKARFVGFTELAVHRVKPSYITFHNFLYYCIVITQYYIHNNVIFNVTTNS